MNWNLELNIVGLDEAQMDVILDAIVTKVDEIGGVAAGGFAVDPESTKATGPMKAWHTVKGPKPGTVVIPEV